MTSFDQCLVWIEDIERANLRFRSTDVHALVEMLRLLTSEFIQLSADERRALTDLVSDQAGKTLIALGTSCALQALNDKDAKLLKHAVIAHIVEDFRVDPRNNIRNLVLIDHAAKLLRVDLKNVIEAVLSWAEPRALEGLASYMRRSDDINVLENFGIILVQESGRYDFVPVKVPFKRF